MRCNERIYLGSDKAYTHCMLPAGHSGEHSIRANGNDMRCVATKDGKRCGQPHGHFGQHTVLNGSAIDISWSEK